MPGAATAPAFPRRTPITAATELPATRVAVATRMPTPPSPDTSALGVHTVVPGDTLLGLARQYGVPMAAIQLKNEMGESTTLRAGQDLSIPTRQEWEGSSPFWIVHLVKPGETLIGIAQTYDLQAADLQAVNGLGDADFIEVGQTLILPLLGPVTALEPTPTAGTEPTLAQKPVEPSPSGPTASPTVSGTAVAPITATVALSPTRAAPSAVPPADLMAWPQEILRLINEERAQQGLYPLAHNPSLEQAAQAHGNDCSQRGWCSHTGSDGADIKTRISRLGYKATGWAECWAQTQSAQRAVEVWMDETPPNDPHRRTLLTTWLTEIGIGVAEADWGSYIIADFGRP